MEINIARQPEQVLRGMDRLLAVVADALPQAPSRPRATSRVPSHWLIERGETRVNASVSAVGGFPGSLRAMNRIGHAQMVATIRYLIVGEGTSQGFAIPMRDVLSASVIRPDRHSNHGLAIWYRDGEQVGSFFLHFRGIARGISGLSRAESVMQFLVERGVAPVEASAARFVPSLHRSWDDVAALATEEFLWAGNGVAAVGGWFGERTDAARVWLTDRNLLWAGASQSGVNVLPLSDICSARDGTGDRVAIGLRDALGHRYDIVLDLAPDHVQLERETNPRVRFMNTIASLGVPVTTASSPLAPWRTGRVAYSPERMQRTEGTRLALR